MFISSAIYLNAKGSFVTFVTASGGAITNVGESRKLTNISRGFQLVKEPTDCIISAAYPPLLLQAVQLVNRGHA
jgi:hypothetical protein